MEIFRTGSVVLGLLLITFVAGTAAAQDQTINISLSTDYFGKYIWRGQNVDDRSVLQPAIAVSAYGFTGSVWGNMDLTNKSATAPDNAWEFSEFDYTLDYTHTIPSIDWLTGSAGVIYYRFPNTALDPTVEIYGGLSLPTIPLSPTFKWYRDVDEIKGSYFQLGVGHSFEKLYVVNDKCYCGLQLNASYGWGNATYDKGYFGVDEGRSNDLTFTAGLPLSVGAFMIKPSINYSAMLSKSIREATDKSNNLWAGLFVSFAF